MIDPHSTLVVVVLVVALIALCALGGYLFAVERFTAHHASGASTETETETGSEAVAAGERYASAAEQLVQALSACEGTRQRLEHLAPATRPWRPRSGKCHAAGFQPSGSIPALGRRGSCGAIIRGWRSARGSRLIAAVRRCSRPWMTPVRSCPRTRSRSIASLTLPSGVAVALHDSEITPVLASCTFCGKRSRQIRKLIAGPQVLICDECVSACVTVIENEPGPDWQAPGDSG